MGKGTKSIRWANIGTIDATAGDADITLGVAERDLQTNIDLDNVVVYHVPKEISAIQVRFISTTNNHTADIEVWQGKVGKRLDVDRSQDCSLQRKMTLDVVCGQQNVQGSATLHFADIINVSNDKTENGVDGGSDGAGAEADQIATIHWDVKGDNIVLFHGFGTVDGDFQIELTGYS